MGSLQFPFASVIPAAGPGYQPAISTANAPDIWIVPCSDGAERLCKGGSVNPKAPCNEWIAAQICQLAGFPVLEPAIVERMGKLYFATSFLQRNQLVSNLNGPRDPRFAAAINGLDIAYQAIAIDALLANPDRHGSNIILASQGPLARGVWAAYLHDHDAALFGAERMNPRGLKRVEHFISDMHDGWIRHLTAWVRDDNQWHLEIKNWNKLIAAANTIMALPDSAIELVLAQCPPRWLTATERTRLRDMLLQRKSNLISILEHRKSLFVNA